jgi:hypothetical protein
MEESLFQTAPPVTARPRWQSLSRGREYEDGKEPIAANGVIRIDRLTGRQTTLSSGGMFARPLATNRREIAETTAITGSRHWTHQVCPQFAAALWAHCE